MPRLNEPGIEPVYEAAEAFREAALRTDGSLFTPGRPIWSLPVLDDLHAKFVGRPDESARSFEVKLREQLHDAGPDTLQLAAEAIYVHLLVARNLHARTKRNLVVEILSWSPRPVSIPEGLDQALEAGIASVGTAFLTKRPYQLQFLVETIQAWKGLPDAEHDALLGDPWRFRQFLFEQPIKGAHSQREALLHLVFPDTFEPITSQAAKQRIAERFRDYAPNVTENVDRQLVAIRQALEPRFGAGFQFYAPQVRPVWQPDASPWGQFVQWAGRFTSWPEFDASERDYKLVIAERLARARKAVLSGAEDWPRLLRRAIAAPNNLTPWRDDARFNQWCSNNPERARVALTQLWDSSQPLGDRIRTFAGALGPGTLGMSLPTISFLLMADPGEYPVYRREPFEKGTKLTGEQPLPKGRNLDLGALYEQALQFLDRIIEESAKRGLELRDRLDAQSVLWAVTRWKASDEPVASWPDVDRRAFLRFRGDAVEDTEPATPPTYWWANQSGNYAEEKGDRHLWAPDVDSASREPYHWAVLKQMKPHDVVVHYVDGMIRAISTVVQEAQETPIPPGHSERVSGTVGGLVRLSPYQELDRPIQLDEIPEAWREGGPFNPSGGVQYGYVFRLSDEFARQLRERFADRWPMEGGDDTGQEATPADDQGRRFADLTQCLEREALHFSEELVANYLLALQTKRLVILSGISGTGKTQLALAVARYFQPLARIQTPVRVPDGAFEVQVQPYMAKHHQWAFRSDLRAALRIPELEAGETKATIEVLYPGGRAEQRVGRDLQSSFWQMSITHPLRAWFDAHLHVGDRFFAEVLPAEDDGPDRLRLSLPDLVTHEGPLTNYEVVAVRPDWTDNRGLLGFFNPLTGHYTITKFLRLVLNAHEECNRAQVEGRAPHPFFAILDEMNLARVEHYFSDFLSALESGEPLDLHQDPVIEAGQGEEDIAVPRRLRVPPNLFFTGTVNIDETTYMFSPKVLDRAFTIELNEVDLAGYRDVVAMTAEEPTSPLALERFPGPLVYERPPGAQDWDRFKRLEGGALYDLVLDLHGVLADEHRHFGYRVANEIARFVTLAVEQARPTTAAQWAALDLAILQKVLPKFHGTQQELEKPLRALFAFAVAGDASGDGPAADPEAWVRSGNLIAHTATDTTTPEVPRLPRTATKVWRMLRRLKQQGFTAFIE